MAGLRTMATGSLFSILFRSMAQEAPVNSVLYADVNGDGKADLIIGGNEYEASVMTGRYDASYGLVLEGDGKGGWAVVSPEKSGLILDGDVRDLKIVTWRASGCSWRR